MALLTVDFFSYYLGMDVPMTVLLPEKRGHKPELTDKKYKVLYLLHGHSDDNTSYIRKSNIEMLIRDKDVIVVMPTGHRGFYSNSCHGYKYEDYLVKELPTVVSNFFHASLEREDTYIAGLSMGGYGALKLALKYPEVYGHAASMSGAIDCYQALKCAKGMFSVGDFMSNVDNVFGGEEAFRKSDDNIENLVSKVRNQPQLYVSCGTEDPLYPIHGKTLEVLDSADIRYTAYEGPGGHNWAFWNQELVKILQFFGLIEGSSTGM